MGKFTVKHVPQPTKPAPARKIMKFDPPPRAPAPAKHKPRIGGGDGKINPKQQVF